MKQKTVKTAQKRAIVTGTGKLKRRNLSAQHLAQGKSKRVKRAANKASAISRADEKKIKRLLPYSR